MNKSELGPNMLILTNLNSIVLLWSSREDRRLKFFAHGTVHATDYIATKDMQSERAFAEKKISGHRCTTYL